MRLFLIPAVTALIVMAPGRPAFVATALMATADDKGNKTGSGEKIKGGEDIGEKLPKAVADAVKSIFPGLTVMKVEKEDEDGDVVYEITLRGKGGTLEAKLTPKGRVVKVEMKGEDEKGKNKKDEDVEKSEKKREGKRSEDEKGRKKSDRD